MNGDRPVKVGLGCAHLQRNSKHLRQFASVGPQNMDAQNLVRVRIDDQLHHHLLVPARKGVLHGTEAGLVDVEVRRPLQRLFLSEANRSQLRLGEDGRCDEAVIHRPGLAAKDGVGKGMAFADGHRGEIGPVGDVAHGIDRRNGGAGRFIHPDGTVLTHFDTSLLEAEARNVRAAADGKEDLIGGQRLAALGVARQLAVCILFDCGERVAADDLDALLLHLFMHGLAQIIVKAAQDFLAAVDERRLGAEAVEDAGEFHGDVAAAGDNHLPRHFGQMEGLVGGDHMLAAGQRGIDIRRAARCDQDVTGRHDLAG